jgi:hypothetical protein
MAAYRQPKDTGLIQLHKNEAYSDLQPVGKTHLQHCPPGYSAHQECDPYTVAEKLHVGINKLWRDTDLHSMPM